jgi:hypothetical protein
MKLFHIHSWFVRVIALSCAALCFCVAGCVETRPKPAPAAVQIVPAQLGSPPATVRKVDITYNFVVLDFSQRAMPPLGTHLTVYRDGQKVGEVQITEPVRAQFATADVLAGELQVGDEAR